MDTNVSMIAYELGADTYDDRHESHGNGFDPYETVVVDSLLRHIEFEDVLDAATGTGRYAIRLAQMGKRVVGIDSSPKMLAQARANAETAGTDVTFQEASVLSLPQQDESFDLVICVLALAHVKELGQATGELVRVLRKGGHLIIVDLHPNIQMMWGPDYKALVSEGRLLIDQSQKDTLKGTDAVETATTVPFPNYHGEVSEYVEGVRATGARLLAAIDVPIPQMLGIAPGELVVLAQKNS